MGKYADAVKEHGSQRAAAKALDIPESTFRDRLKKEKKLPYSLRIIDEIPPDGMEVKGVSTLYDEMGNVKLEWVKTEAKYERTKQAINDYLESIKEEVPVAKKIEYKGLSNTDLMSIIPFGDPHFGLYCWAKEVGNDFNLEIAKRDLCNAVKYLVDKSPESERFVIINTGDFFHAENMIGATSKSGHILDMASRPQDIMNVGISAFRFCIEYAAAKHKKVEVINAPGNHDEILSHAMTILFRNVYENNPRIKIHDSPTERHYIKHGKVMIGAVHGHKTKDRDLPLIMATENPEWWGETKHRYFYRGHHHHDSRVEYNGCIVEQVRTLSPGDAYAVGGGYLSGRDMKLIVHHKEYGEVSRSTCSIDLLSKLMHHKGNNFPEP